MIVAAIVQARLGSTRLPGKVLEDLAGQPMLVRVVNRVSRAKTIDVVVVATTTRPADDAIVRLCEEQGWPFFRGSEADLLDRYYRAALAFKANVLVRITSDCPLIDPGVIDTVVTELLSHPTEVDYVSNTQQRTYPRGLDTEVMTLRALERAWREDDDAAQREHVTPYIYRNPEEFVLRSVTSDIDLSHMRWTVDTAQDLAFVCKIYHHFQNDAFTWREVIDLLEIHREWLEINRSVQQKPVS